PRMRWVWESLRPGITVAPSRSMTRVPGPFDGMTSAVVPTWENVPWRIATASADGRLPSMVAKRPLRRITSAVPVADDVMAPPGIGLLVADGGRYRVLREARRRSLVHHGVRVLDADAVGAAVVLDDVHDGVVRLLVGPVTLPLEHDRDREDGLGAGLDHALHSVVVRERAQVAAAVLHDVDFVAVVDRLHGGQRDACLG